MARLGALVFEDAGTSIEVQAGKIMEQATCAVEAAFVKPYDCRFSLGGRHHRRSDPGGW